MKPIIATIVGLFTIAMLLVLLPLAAVSKTARKSIRVIFALIAAVVLVDELKELFVSKPMTRAVEAATAGETALTPAALALQAALKAGGRVS